VPAGRNSWPAPCRSPAGLANIYRVGCALEKRMPARNHGRVGPRGQRRDRPRRTCNDETVLALAGDSQLEPHERVDESG
jgi:hypothetical protein